MPGKAEKEMLLRRQVYIHSPYFLGKEILGFGKFCETQIEWDIWFSEAFQFSPQNRTFALKLAPRETFKSTFFVVTCAISMLLRNPNLTILICCETQSNANAHLKEIKNKIESEIFKGLFGDLKDENCWRDDSMNINTRTHFTKESNIEAAGVGKSLTGKHYDVVIGDDLVGNEDRDSEPKRKMTFDFFNGLFDVLKKETGQGLFTGTRWHREDLYNHIIKKLAPDMRKKNLAPFHVSVVPCRDKSGALNYPRLLPESRLLELRTVKQGKDGVDSSTFAAQYDLDPMSPEEQIFKSFVYTNINENKYEQFLIWTDPALSKKETACFSATVALAKTGVYWDVVYASMKRRSPTEIMEDHNRIYRMMRDLYRISGDAYMEDNGFQLLVAQGAIQASIDDNDPVPTVGRHNSENKVARIRSMEPHITQGFIRFRSDYETAPENYHILMEQLQNFPQGLMDGPDALQCGHHETQQFASFRSLT